MRVNNRYVSFYYENDNDMGAIEIDPEKTALLVVDMQHVFITRPTLEKSNTGRTGRSRKMGTILLQD